MSRGGAEAGGWVFGQARRWMAVVALCGAPLGCGSAASPSEDLARVASDDMAGGGHDAMVDLSPPDDLTPAVDLTPADLTVPPDLVDPNGWVLDPARPLSAAAPKLAAVNHPQPPGALWTTATAPLPTNTWWMNLVLGSGDQPVYVAPYSVQAVANGVTVGVPALSASPTGETQTAGADLLLQTTETLIGHTLRGHDALSATLSYQADKGVGTMQVPLVPGSPYFTIEYFDTTPSFLPAQGVSITSVNGANVSPVSAARIEIALDNGHTWVLYAQRPIHFDWTPQGMVTNLPWVGPVRLALLTSVAATALLDADWQTVPVGGEVKAAVGGDTATVTLSWQIDGSGPLLMLSLPHHRAAGVGVAAMDPSFDSLMGTLLPVEGAEMTLTLPLSTIGWSAPRAVDPAHQADVVAALAADLAYAPDAMAADADPYEGPRQMQALARLAQIADDLGDATSSATLRARLSPLVEAWLDARNSDPLVYDTTWGGVITTAGQKSPDGDGGNGYYADHHVQYGHLLYAAAVLAHDDAAWATRYHDAITLLVRDIASPATGDRYFAPFRYMDFYYGHGWGTGLSATPHGPRAASSSEAANAWYAIRLLGDVYADPTLRGLGRMLLGVETLSAQTYFQVASASTVYQAPFSDGHVVGTLWAGEADLASLLGASATYSYASQLRPFTPATEDLLGVTWAGDVKAQLLSAAAAKDAVPSWTGYLYQGQAVTDKAAAWTSLSAAGAFEPGTTKTSALWWAATRP